MDHQAEYIDEDKYTTVTVEEMDPSKQALRQLDNEEEEVDEDGVQAKRQSSWSSTGHHANPIPTKKKAPAGKSKRKKAKFRYESKDERKLHRAKQRLSKKKRADARRER